MNGITIRIYPLKKLYQLLADEGTAGVAAIISTSGNGPNLEQLRGIPFVCCNYRDIDFEGIGALSDSDAEHFASFIQSIGPDIRTIYCVCDAAISRSPAVAAAVARYFEIDVMDLIWRNSHFKPNMLVFEKICTALKVPVSDSEMDMLMYESEKAFKTAITTAYGK